VPKSLNYAIFGDSYSEFLLNEFRREYPNTAKEILNMIPSSLLEPEKPMTTQNIATLQTELSRPFETGFADTSQFVRLQSLKSISVGDYIYSLVGVWGRGALEKFQINWNIVEWNVKTNEIFTFSSVINFTSEQDLPNGMPLDDFAPNFLMWYDYDRKRVYVSFNGDIFYMAINPQTASISLNSPIQVINMPTVNTITSVMATAATNNSAVHGSQFDVFNSAAFRPSFVQSVATWCKQNNLPRAHRSRIGWFLEQFSGEGRSQDIIQGNLFVWANPAAIPTPSAVPSFWFTQTNISPVLNDVVVAMGTAPAAFTRIFQFQVNEQTGNNEWVLTYDDQVAGMADRTIYSPSFTGSLSQALNVNPTISFIFQPIKLETEISAPSFTFVKPQIEEDVDISEKTIDMSAMQIIGTDNSGVARFPARLYANHPNMWNDNPDKTQIMTISPINSVSGTTANEQLYQENEYYFMDISGNLVDPMDTYNAMRVYRTVQSENSAQNTFHFVCDLPLSINMGQKFWYYTESTGYKVNQLQPNFNPNPNFAEVLEGMSFDDILRNISARFNAFGLSNIGNIGIQAVIPMDNFKVFAFDNCVGITQNYRNGTAANNDQTDTFNPNRGVLTFPEKVLNIGLLNDDILVMTTNGIYSIDSVSTNIFIGNDGIRDFRRNQRRVFNVNFSTKEQLYITSQNTPMIIGDNGKLFNERGEVNLQWGYENRYKNTKTLSIAETLTKMVIHTPRTIGIRNQMFTVYTEDVLHNGWATYARNITKDKDNTQHDLYDLVNLVNFGNDIFSFYVEHGESDVFIITKLFDDTYKDYRDRFFTVIQKLIGIILSAQPNNYQVSHSLEVWVGCALYSHEDIFSTARENGSLLTVPGWARPFKAGVISDQNAIVYLMNIDTFKNLHDSGGGIVVRMFAPSAFGL